MLRRAMARSTASNAALVLAVALASCTQASPRPVPAPPPQLPDSSRGRHVPTAPPSWYWEPLEPDLRGEKRGRPVPLPAAADTVTRFEGGARVWDELGDAGRARLRQDGIVVVSSGAPSVPRWEMGAFYTEWRGLRVPYVVTLDALFALTHRALCRALADVEQRELAPLLEAVLARLDQRLAAEHRGAGVELEGGYRLARGIVAVARAVLDPAYEPAPELAAVVREETSRIEAHSGRATSPLLGVPVDYAQLVVPASSAHRGHWRAMGWLAAAPLALVARTEVPGAPVDVGGARLHARAAMILARLADHDVDMPIHGALARISRLLAFVWGVTDDVTPLELGDLADSVGVDLAKAQVIANVVAVDKVRARARATRTPLLFDGSGGAGRAGVSVRVFGGHAALDSVAVAGLASGSRELPTALQLGEWLASPDARAAADAVPLHGSVHGSLVDALLAWSEAAPSSDNAARARLESVLSAWSLVRHAGEPFAQPKPVPHVAREAKPSGAPLPAFVEAEPIAIARLVATVAQIRRGLAALGPLPKGSPGDGVLAETEDLLHAALRVAERAARDESLAESDAAALAAFPARLAALDAELATDGPYAAVIYSDPATRRSVVTAAGGIEPAFVLIREPGTPRIFVAVGAHLAHHEGVVSSDDAAGPATEFAQRIREGREARAAWTGAFRMAR